MSDLTKEAAYIKGLFDGLKLDAEKAETKILKSIIDFLEKSAEQSDMFDREQEFLAEGFEDLEFAVDSLKHDVAKCLEAQSYDDDYQIKCDSCGADVAFSEDEVEDLLNGDFVCPECGAPIILDLGDHDCECGCEHDGK